MSMQDSGLMLRTGAELKPASGRSQCKLACCVPLSLLGAELEGKPKSVAGITSEAAGPASSQRTVRAHSACLQMLSEAQQESVLLVARLWRLEFHKGPDNPATQPAKRCQLLLMDLRLAGVTAAHVGR